NGPPDGDSGLSMLFGGGFDASREIADDFVLKGGPGWLVDGMAISYIWGAGINHHFGDFLVEIYADDVGGGPGTVVSSQIVPVADEFLTGDEYFGRPEIRVSTKFSPVELAADTTYWIEMIPLDAPQNGFVLTSGTEKDGTIDGSQVYIRFPKFGFPDWDTGDNLFGHGHDISFSLQGEVIPAPCPWDLDGSGTVGATDLLSLLVTWGKCADCNDCPADFDGNGTVGASDLLALLVNWGPCP
ncbi:MAG: hypothetical protein V3T84_03220, partial [Phycisphaerales bacterium]